MKLNIKYKYLGDPAVCFRDPVPGRDPWFGKRWWIYTFYLKSEAKVKLSFPATPVGVRWNPWATYCVGYYAKLVNAYKHA